MRYLKHWACIAFAIFSFSISVNAQKTQTYENQISWYNQAHELMRHEQYTEAQKMFLDYASVATDRETKINARYYAGVCAMELFNPDAINMLLAINAEFPEHSKSKSALFQLGKYFYRVKDNKSALLYFSYVSAEDLTPEDADEYHFLRGYCYFKTEKFEDSKRSFANIKSKPGKYFDASNYYYGYVVYRQGNYDEALTHFNLIKNSKSFGPLAKVYLAQIWFTRKQYQEVIGVAESVTEKEVLDDAAGIIGQSYYNLGNYEKAAPYLERYNSNPPIARTSQDIYRLGFCYYKSGLNEKAVDQFTTIGANNDTIAQYANFYLGQIYLKTDKKQAAKSAFQLAHKYKYAPEVAEEALFIYARICSELNIQQEALKEYVNFINLYPESKHNDEARAELSNLLLSTKNYKEAIRIIEGIENLKDNTKLAYQRVCYYRAEELYLNNEYAAAETMFLKSQKFELDKRLYALSYFWLAELNYKNGNYETAYNQYNTFSGYPENKDSRFFALANYNRGYCKLKLLNYLSCIEEMNKFISSEYAKSNPELYTDAYMRIADCYFAINDYKKALESYEVIVGKKLNGSDYALYQKAMIYGVLNKPEEKINALKLITQNYKRSTYIDDALFEMANVKLQTDQYQDAIDGFNNILDNYPRSSYIRRAYLNKGLAYYNMGKDEPALETFKKLITDYSQTDEAREALTVIRNIFINKGESEAYLSFIKVLPNVTVSPSYQDSVTFESAYNIYKTGDCQRASKALGGYISKFNGGYFILKAHSYKAECDFKLKSYDEALISYEFIAQQNRNDFTERAIRQCAVISYMQNKFDKAFSYYSSLERIASNRDNLSISLLGQIKSAASLNRTDSAAQASFRYLNSTITQKDGVTEARFQIGKFYMNKNLPDSALPEFTHVVKETKNAMAAEAKYNLALIRYLKKDNKAARKNIYDLADNFSAYEYWVAKGYLLLADIFITEKDNFQAKATLQSLLENYDGEDLKNIASEKLRTIIAEEEKVKDANKKPVVEKEIQKF